MVRVMLAVKHKEVLEGLYTVLRLANNIEVSGAASGLSSAIRQAGAECPDVVLVDLEMPDGEGYEIIRQVSRLNPCTKVVALTAHEYTAAQKSALQAGASAVIVKGLDLMEMVAAIQAVTCAKKA